MSEFAARLIAWQRLHGRHDLPWQSTRDPYRVWLSEIMLQQTQVATVIPYYQRFLARFPTLGALAAAPLEEVMMLWSGLGYYARARNLHHCAQAIISDFGGRFPRDPQAIAGLPGIGRSTAHAIAAFCFGARVPILDGNVKRLLCRFLGIDGYPGLPAIESRLWREATTLLPERDIATYIQAQMDLGASVCRRQRPRCDVCPVGALCVANREGRTADLPTPREKRVLPWKLATLLVLRHDGRIALEARPPAGLWGGLLSLPELPEGADARQYCARRFGLVVGAVFPAPSLRHGFTHFRLLIQPLICMIECPQGTAEANLVWFAPQDCGQAPLPAPVKKILSAIP